MSEKIEVLNVNHPGLKSNVDAEKYAAMKKALLKVLPKKSPGLTQKEMMEQVKAHLPEALFPIAFYKILVVNTRVQSLTYYFIKYVHFFEKLTSEG